MPQPQGYEQARNAIEHKAPRILYAVAEKHLQVACNHHKDALSEYCRKPVERTSNTYKPGLFMLVHAEHIEAVGSNVVRGTAERHYPKEKQRALKPETGGNGERHASKSRTDEQLHGDYPPTLGLDNIYKRTPKAALLPRGRYSHEV